MTQAGAGEAVQRYLRHSRQYLENALLALRRQEAAKAGELLWGSVAEMLQAVAASWRVPIHSHRDLKNFAIQLGRDLGDSTLQRDVALAESLHQNFYVVALEPQDIEAVLPTVQDLLPKLAALIPPEATQEQAHV